MGPSTGGVRMHPSGHRGYRISRATLSDTAPIARVHVDGWRSSYRGLLPTAFLDALSYAQREDLWRGVLADAAGRHVFTAREADGPIVGFALGGPPQPRLPGYLGELHAMYVDESHQRRGVGTGLFHAVVSAFVEEGIDSMVTWTFIENPAVRFYEHLGGRRLDERSIEIAGDRVEEVAFGWAELVTQVVHHGSS